MKFFKKITSIVLSMFFLIGTMGILSACQSEDDEEKLYDVTIVIGSDDGGEWVFPPDVTELHITREYDGQEHRYFVSSYNLADHPRWGNEWFTPSGEGANVFDKNILFWNLEGIQSEVRVIKEKGKYNIHVTASATSDLWNFRSMDLQIDVI